MMTLVKDDASNSFEFFSSVSSSRECEATLLGVMLQKMDSSIFALFQSKKVMILKDHKTLTRVKTKNKKNFFFLIMRLWTNKNKHIFSRISNVLENIVSAILGGVYLGWQKTTLIEKWNALRIGKKFEAIYTWKWIFLEWLKLLMIFNAVLSTFMTSKKWQINI